jgi:hypothetical protein
MYQRVELFVFGAIWVITIVLTIVIGSLFSRML